MADWLRSDVGQRTIASYAPDGEALFGPPGAVEEEVVESDVEEFTEHDEEDGIDEEVVVEEEAEFNKWLGEQKTLTQVINN